MPRILYRYLVLEILPPFGVSLLGFTSIVFLGRMMKVTQMIVVKGVGLIDVLKTCVFLLPYLLVFTLPMAATVGRSPLARSGVGDRDQVRWPLPSSTSRSTGPTAIPPASCSIRSSSG